MSTRQQKNSQRSSLTLSSEGVIHGLGEEEDEKLERSERRESGSERGNRGTDEAGLPANRFILKKREIRD